MWVQAGRFCTAPPPALPWCPGRLPAASCSPTLLASVPNVQPNKPGGRCSVSAVGPAPTTPRGQQQAAGQLSDLANRPLWLEHLSQWRRRREAGAQGPGQPWSVTPEPSKLAGSPENRGARAQARGSASREVSQARGVPGGVPAPAQPVTLAIRLSGAPPPMPASGHPGHIRVPGQQPLPRPHRGFWAGFSGADHPRASFPVSTSMGQEVVPAWGQESLPVNCPVCSPPNDRPTAATPTRQRVSPWGTEEEGGVPVKGSTQKLPPQEPPTGCRPDT